MSHTLTISDELYTRLATTARQQGVSIEELLERWPHPSQSDESAELRARREAFDRIAALSAELSARYGEMPLLLRERRCALSSRSPDAHQAAVTTR